MGLPAREDRDRRGRMIATTIALVAAVKVKLNATGRALLKAHHGKLTATLTVRNSSPSPAATIHKTVHVVQKGAN
jgi:hypothetical protein